MQKGVFTGILLAMAIVLLAGGAIAQEQRSVSIELNEEQLGMIGRTPEEEVTIQLTSDQVSIIVHNFPQVEVVELTLTADHLCADGTVTLEESGRTGVAPVAPSR